MPIVNGTYVPDTLGSPKAAQQQVFGDYTKRDMNDYSTAAYNYLQKQQEQAYNLELWNLTNQYNSPEAQMKRFQDAGLNPALIYSQQNTAQSPASASAASFRPQNLAQKQAANAISSIGQIMNIVKSARETYDYMKYGREASSLQNQLDSQRIGLLSRQETAQFLKNEWEMFLQGRNDLPEFAPGVRMYKYQLDTQQQKYEQLKAVINAIPDQTARTRALKELDAYRLQILQGQYGAIMNINTGIGGLDAFLKMLGFYLLGK